MKKVLLTTSALAGASLVAAPAMADAPAMTFSGALAYELIVSGGDEKDAGTGTMISANEQQSEFVWDARGSADNGLNYRANIQWRWAAGGTPGEFDEAWMDFTGGFGRLYLGAEDGVSDMLGGTSGTNIQVGTWATDGNNALRHVNFLGLNTTLHYFISHLGGSSDYNKVGYVTPNFGGFTAGVSWSPNSGFGQAEGTDNDANANALELAANWAGSFGDVSIEVGGGYGMADDDAGVNGNAQEDISSYMVGAIVGFAGFQVGAQFVDNDDSGCPKATNNCDAGDGWNIGAAYNFGPGAVSVYWQEAEDDTDGNGQADESNIFHAGVNYRIAEGLSAHLNGYWFDLETESGSGVADNSNDATVVILGTRITF